MRRKLNYILALLLIMAQGTWAQSTSDIGKVLAADGKMYKTVAAATNAGTTASGIIAYWGEAGSVESGNSSYRGMAIAIEDAVLRWGDWPDHTNYCSSDNHQCSTATSYCSTVSTALDAINGIAATKSAQANNGSGHWHNGPCNGYKVDRPSGASMWAIPSVGQWKLMAQGLTGKSSNLSDTDNPDYTYDKLSAKITAAGGNTLVWLLYWSSTEMDASKAWTFDLGGINSDRNGSRFNAIAKNHDNQYMHVRMFFAFSSATAAVYTISYNSNGGSGAPSNQTKDGGIDLTLSSTVPTRSGYAFAGWNTKADGSGTSYASGATFTDNANTTLYAQWTFQGSGSSTDPYLIPSADVWNFLADQVSAGNTYSGKYFRQTEDISVSTMVGATSSHKFSGTYDGDGHTLTVNYNSTAQYAAPFSYADGATFKNLHIAGSITSSAKYVASFVGYSYGSNTFLNCRSSVAITSSITGDGTHGGFVGILEGDNVSDYTVTFEGCVFNGKLLGSNTTNCGGFVGWSQTHRKIRINLSNCLYAPQEVTISISGCQTFSRGQVLSDIFSTNTNNYYIESLGGTQGKQACSISAGDDVTINNLGDGTEYNVSGITAYAYGIKYGGTYYAGNGDVVSLTLSHAEKSGFSFSQFAVTGDGSLANPTTDTPTLTMIDANQVINAEWKKLLSNTDITIADIPSQAYNNTALTPVVSITDGSTALIENTDFSISTTTDCINAGEYEVTITGIGNYDGTANKTFSIVPAVTNCGAATITWDQSGKKVTFDGTSLATIDITSDIAVDAIVLSRTFTAGKPATIMLPFTTSVGNISGATFYTFSGVTKPADKWIATMTEVNQVKGTLEANTPYLVVPTGSTLTFMGGAMLNTAGGGNQQTADVGSNWTFKGTYAYKEWITGGANAEEIGKAYGFAGVQNTGIEVGDFVKVASGAKIRPMGCYLLWSDTPNSSSAPARKRARAANVDELPSRITVLLVSANGETTGIGELNTTTGEISLDRWWTLDGVKLSGKPAKKGLYIHNGNKVIIK